MLSYRREGALMDDEEAKALHRELGRYWASKRQPKERTCAVCGKSFVTIGRGAYCSGRCRVAAHRSRKRPTPPHPQHPPTSHP